MLKKLITIILVLTISILSNAQNNCVANFTSFSSVQTTTFTNTSSCNGVSTYVWDFGDGNNSFLNAPVHTYSNNGYYLVCLTIICADSNTGVTCTDVYCDSVYVSGSFNCTTNAAFSHANNGLSTFFSNQSSCAGTATNSWNFGDGSPLSTATNPSHNYANPGVYNVCLITTCNVQGTTCSDTTCMTVQVTNSTGCNATANYIATSNMNTATFSNISTCSGMATFTWSFGDGSFSNMATPTHTYANSGTYNVFLTMVCIDSNNTTCIDSFCNTVVVNGSFNCTTNAAFTHTNNGLNTFFSNQSSCGGTATYSWNFGDGSPLSSAINPNHTYSIFGVYNVCLITTCNVQGTTCSDTTCMNIQVFNNTGCNATASFIPTSVGLNAAFSNSSICNGTMTNYTWSFGDGGSSNAMSPSHTYATAGNYSVCLTVVCIDSNNTTCIDSICQQVQVGNGTGCIVTSNFTGGSTGMNAWFTNTTNCGGTAVYSWDFGDGTPLSTMQNPTHTFTTTGNHMVCLYTICNVQGMTCVDSFCMVMPIQGTSAVSNITKNTEKLQVYPNPVTNNTFIELASLQNQTIVIYEVSGKIISTLQTGVLTNKKYSLNTASLSPGMYFVVVSDDKSKYRASFIKQ
jgi:PKD repeat protein